MYGDLGCVYFGLLVSVVLVYVFLVIIRLVLIVLVVEVVFGIGFGVIVGLC